MTVNNKGCTKVASSNRIRKNLSLVYIRLRTNVTHNAWIWFPVDHGGPCTNVFVVIYSNRRNISTVHGFLIFIHMKYKRIHFWDIVWFKNSNVHGCMIFKTGGVCGSDIQSKFFCFPHIKYISMTNRQLTRPFVHWKQCFGAVSSMDSSPCFIQSMLCILITRSTTNSSSCCIGTMWQTRIITKAIR